ncbi:hypothetical protein [Arthrobacter bambusae]|nr:hypothetical protein [Arthrobacter bambusae]MDQ0239183.1 hypothetical protein [Arthrobacter bambusae]
MKVQEAMAAYRDGTFETKVNTERRRDLEKEAKPGLVQKGRDLYESM